MRIGDGESDLGDLRILSARPHGHPARFVAGFSQRGEEVELIDAKAIGLPMLDGGQGASGGEELTPLGYYDRAGPFGRVFAAWPPGLADHRVLGLGTGVLGCYARAREAWTFRETGILNRAESLREDLNDLKDTVAEFVSQAAIDAVRPARRRRGYCFDRLGSRSLCGFAWGPLLLLRTSPPPLSAMFELD